MTLAALLGWVQARLFGRDVPELPNKAAYVYSAVAISAFAWSFRLAIDRIVATGYRRRPVATARADTRLAG